MNFFYMSLPFRDALLTYLQIKFFDIWDLLPSNSGRLEVRRDVEDTRLIIVIVES